MADDCNMETHEILSLSLIMNIKGQEGEHTKEPEEDDKEEPEVTVPEVIVGQHPDDVNISSSLSSFNINTNTNNNNNITILNYVTRITSQIKGGIRQAQFRITLMDILCKVNNPLTIAVRIVSQCPGYGKTKVKSIAYQVMEEVIIWKRNNSILPTLEDKQIAYYLAVNQDNLQFTTMILDAYELRSERELFFPKIKDLLRVHEYAMAQCLVISFDLCDRFETDELVLPLILQGKHNLADEILTKCPSKVPPFVFFLDGLLTDRTVIREKFQNLPELKREKLQQKQLSKLIAKLCKKFDVSPENASNLNTHRKYAFLHYIVPKKYSDGDMGEEAFRDIVFDTVGDSFSLKKTCVRLIAKYDQRHARNWSIEFGLENDFNSHRAVNNYYSHPGRNGFHQRQVVEPSSHFRRGYDSFPPPDDSDPSSQRYYRLHLPLSEIFIVDTPDKFASVLCGSLSAKRLIGIDCEWKPSFGTKATGVSLLQIATPSAVFLFDVRALSDDRYSVLWNGLARQILENPEIVKVGFGIDNDLKEIRTSIPGYGNLRSKDVGYLELSSLWKTFVGTGIRLPYPDENSGMKLTSITEQCFGRSLDKREQCSNWENRPLRMTQLRYAALDAYVLLDIYYFIRRKYHEQNLNFDETCFKIMKVPDVVESKGSKKKNKNKPQATGTSTVTNADDSDKISEST